MSRREKLMIVVVLVTAVIGIYSLMTYFENAHEECQDICIRQAVDCVGNRADHSLDSTCAEIHFACDIECGVR